MEILTAIILAISVLVTDPAGHPMRPIPAEGARAIATGCLASPLFVGDTDGSHCAALLTVMAARESGYRLMIAGDGGQAHGPWQVHAPQPTTWAAAVASYLPIVRRSMIACPEHPLAVLASGSCSGRAGRAISASRIAETKRVWAATHAADTAPSR